MYQNCVDYQLFEHFYDTSQIKKSINIHIVKGSNDAHIEILC